MRSGFVQDVSARGLFVLTTVVPEEGVELRIRIDDAELGWVSVIGKVTRKRRTHRSVSAVDPGGFGVEVLSADEAFFRLLLNRGLG